MEVPGINPKVGKEAFPHAIPFPAPVPQLSPMAAYLSRLAPSLRLTMAKLLLRIVSLLGSSTVAEAFPWSRLTICTSTSAGHRETLDQIPPGWLMPDQYPQFRPHRCWTLGRLRGAIDSVGHDDWQIGKAGSWSTPVFLREAKRLTGMMGPNETRIGH
jgi:hypothetical protein